VESCSSFLFFFYPPFVVEVSSPFFYFFVQVPVEVQKNEHSLPFPSPLPPGDESGNRSSLFFLLFWCFMFRYGSEGPFPPFFSFFFRLPDHRQRLRTVPGVLPLFLFFREGRGDPFFFLGLFPLVRTCQGAFFGWGVSSFFISGAVFYFPVAVRIAASHVFFVLPFLPSGDSDDDLGVVFPPLSRCPSAVDICEHPARARPLPPSFFLPVPFFFPPLFVDQSVLGLFSSGSR